jgi:SAM-dependent methyltransferase
MEPQGYGVDLDRGSRKVTAVKCVRAAPQAGTLPDAWRDPYRPLKICPACERRFTAPDWLCPACAFEPPVRDGVRVLMPEIPDKAEGYDPDAFERLVELEHGSFWFEARNELIIWALERYFPHARSFLEIGCGTGFVLAGIKRARPGLELTGTDAFLEGLAVARSRLGDIEFEQVDATQIPYDGEFDVVGAFDVIEHLEDDEAALGGLHRALRPGGGAIITVPQHQWLWGPWDVIARHVRRYRRRELIAKARAAGFTVDRVTSFVSLLFPLMVAARLRRRHACGDADRSELRPAGLLNAILMRIMHVEAALIRRGIGLPAGGSLLLVARRNSARNGSPASRRSGWRNGRRR